MYSIGNEVTEPAEKRGVDLALEMTELIHGLDPTRPVTCGVNLWLISKSAKGKSVYDEQGKSDKKDKQINSTVFNLITSMVGTKMNNSSKSKKVDAVTSPVLDVLDIAGYNYSSGRYSLEGRAHPDRIVVGSETFPQDIAKNWRMVQELPYLIGDFMWTCWDYLGEAGIGAWSYSPDARGFNKPYPWLLAEAGAFDILGNPTAEVFHASAVWGTAKNPGLAVQPPNHPNEKISKMVWRGTNAIPSWSWMACDGNMAVVEVYSSCPVVELLLNGQSLGQKKTKDCKAVFRVRYASGHLTAVAFDVSGKETGKTTLQSASGSIGIEVTSEVLAVKTGSIAYVRVSLVGENGIVECNADREISLSVSGCELLAFGSANPRTEERYNSKTATTYYGKALAVVRATKEGSIVIAATDSQSVDAVASITVN